MSTHTLLGFHVLGLFVICAISLAAEEVCSGASGRASSGASGTVLLQTSSTKQVKWEETEVQAHGEDAIEARIALPQTVLSYRTEMERLKAMANLEYDSDGDDSAVVQELAGLEFNDQELINADSLHAYAASKGYSEGDDASFAPDVWNSAAHIKSSHNCYMYSLNDLSPRSSMGCSETQQLAASGNLTVDKHDIPKLCKRYFHKPGYYFQNIVSGRAKTDVWFREETTCKLMLPMIAADSPAITWNNDKNMSLTEDDECPESHYMAALVIQPKAGFHFYRRDHHCEDNASEWCWSHKPGIMKATDLDASGKKIKSVLKANRNYGELNYSEHCAFYCVPQNRLARTHSDSRKAH